MKTEIILPLDNTPLPVTVGSKTTNLARLMSEGYLVPKTFACTWEAYLLYKQNDPAILSQLQNELKLLLNPDLSYAVRSSANIEDNLEHSFAGQFRTILDVRGISKIFAAIQDIWEAACSEAASEYLARIGAGEKELKMGVIIQEMVPAELSGVAFSKNPITGFDEVIVEAVPGSGEMLVQGGVTPQRWVSKWGEWIEQPEDGPTHQVLFEEIVAGTRAISKTFKLDVDLEWVYDGRRLYWVQMREITCLNQPHLYSNKIAKDMLPGMIKPLIWSVNTPIVNGTWVDLLTELIGKNDIDPASLSRAFYYRTYFDMGTFGKIFERLGLPAESLEMMMGIQAGGQKMPMFKPSAQMLALLPRLLRFISDKWAFSRQIDQRLPDVRSRYQTIAAQQSRQMDDSDRLEQIEQLKSITSQAAYLNIVAPLLMALYNGMLRRQMQKASADYERLDLMDGIAALQDYDPDYHLRRLNGLYCQLSADTQQRILESSFTEFQSMSGIEEFQAQVAEFLERFGHLSDSGNDFSSVPWRENPDLILRMITSYMQREDKPGEKLTFDQIPVIGLRRWRMARTYRNAQRYRLYREQISSVYTFGYGLFRESYLALGDSLVRQGILAEREDIFYLYDPEVLSFFTGEASGEDFAEKVSQRKQEMELFRNIELPELIYGDHPPPVQLSTSQVLRGTPTSRGYYTGQVKNVRGISDFPKVVKGDVIVVPYSDVGWTPLFARAGAVIAESGGILSHSSIIAREYNIPAVVSVAGALQLNDNTRVTVDGYKGEIVIHQPESIPG